MSGGHFDYKQYQWLDVIDAIEEYVYGHKLDEEEINEIEHPSPYNWYDDDVLAYMKEHHHTMPNRYEFSEETLSQFRTGIAIIKMANIYAQRIDWLLSGDDGEESFHERLDEELIKLTEEDDRRNENR